MKKLTIVISMLAMVLGFQNCSDVGFSDSASNGGESQCLNPPCAVSNSLNPGSINHTQPAATQVSKVDILFVTDTSGSINQERAAIANGLDNLVANLPAAIDYNIAVLLAHGPNSNQSGRLYEADNEGAVLQSSQLQLNQIQNRLREKIEDPAGDQATDGGEVGLYSLQRLLDPANLSTAQSQGFFRLDAALAIIFISDENDICAVYPAGINPVPDGQGAEIATKAGLCVQQNITAQNTYQKLLAQQAGRPLTVTGILYNNVATVPNGGENEVAYGYLDVIALNGSTSADLAGDIPTGLATLGTLVTSSFFQRTLFAVSNPAITNCNNQIEPSSISAVVNGASVPFSWNGQLCAVQINSANAGGALAQVAIKYQYWTFPN